MLRVLTQRDLPQLVSIEAAIQLTPWSQETFEKCFQAECRGWGIEKAGQLIGFILTLSQVGECHILSLGVLPSFQCQGYGSQLLNHALVEVKQQGAVIAYLEVRRSNESAIALYTKMGFKKIGERKSYYSTIEGREDAWVFAKKLDKSSS